MNLLAEGTVHELACDPASCAGRGYRLVRKERSPNQPFALYFRSPCELGIELIIGRPCLVSAVSEARAQGRHVIVAGYVGWHPLYGFADEYWGMVNWDSDKATEGSRSYAQRLKNVALVSLTLGVDPGLLNENVGLKMLSDVDHGLYGLPSPSPKALSIAKEKAVGKRFFTFGPTVRKNGYEARDFHSWPRLHEELSKFGLDAYATCPKCNAADIPCHYVEDMVGIENLMDLELAMHSQAVASLASNSGTAGLMIYANTPNAMVFGGVGGYSPGWDGMRERLHKIPGYRTRLFQPKPMFGPDDQTIADAVDIFKGLL